MHTYLTPDPVIVEIRNAAGHVTVDLTESVTTSTVTVEQIPGAGGLLGDLVAGFRRDSSRADVGRSGHDPVDDVRVDLRMVDSGGGVLIVDTDPARSGWKTSFAVTVTAPLGSGVRVQAQSADVRIDGRADRLDVRSASGDVTVGTIERGSLVQTASGSIRVGEHGADAEFRTASGDVTIGRSGGSVSVHATSGDVRVAEPLSDVFVRNVSGDVEIGSFLDGVIEATSVSGDVSIGLLPGALAKIDLRTVSGGVRNDFEVESDQPDPAAGDAADPQRRISLTCRTTSGDIRLRRIATGSAWVTS
ncbi:DUF4097 family beta strand repeat-containing protein [Nakamurella sp. A5-74]|uniref:DUF4097 family beta strand repeat-containing protein n=1 Tax=Nakamurella sp. A5-74 TaxID=3158264 RepID=A0AAU8DJS1_9ACTN